MVWRWNIFSHMYSISVDVGLPSQLMTEPIRVVVKISRRFALLLISDKDKFSLIADRHLFDQIQHME